MQYARTAFGSNPHAGVNPNDDHGWGGYQWPKGVPASKLATLKFNGKLGTIVMVGRKELMPLVGNLMKITEEKYGYYFHPGWCWSYENRSVTGSTTVASNHSRGKAFDFNAPENPYSWTWQCDIPPAVVALWEKHGFYWGGRYTGQPTDPMHFEFCLAPSQVAKMLNSSKNLLGDKGNTPTPDPIKPPPAPEKKASITVKDVTAKQVQKAVNDAGYKPALKVDGILGAKSLAGILWAQRKFGLEDDGIVGPKTWAALSKVGKPKIPPFPLKNDQVFGTPLKAGYRSDGVPWKHLTRSGYSQYGDGDDIRSEIEKIQKALKVGVDGRFGPNTERGTMSFQRSKGLPDDGMVGPNTWKALFS